MWTKQKLNKFNIEIRVDIMKISEPDNANRNKK